MLSESAGCLLTMLRRSLSVEEERSFLDEMSDEEKEELVRVAELNGVEDLVERWDRVVHAVRMLRSLPGRQRIGAGGSR